MDGWMDGWRDLGAFEARFAATVMGVQMFPPGVKIPALHSEDSEPPGPPLTGHISADQVSAMVQFLAPS